MTIHIPHCPHPGHARFNPANGDGERDIKGGCQYCLNLLVVWQSVQLKLREFAERRAA